MSALRILCNISITWVNLMETEIVLVFSLYTNAKKNVIWLKKEWFFYRIKNEILIFIKKNLINPCILPKTNNKG